MTWLRATALRALDGVARLLVRLADSVTSRSATVPNPVVAVRTVQLLLAETGGGDFYEAVQERLTALGFPPVGCGGCNGYSCTCDDNALAELVQALGPLAVRGLVRSAVELFGTYGDHHDVLSITQVDQLCAAATLFDAE
ncbi:hypothetical protein [Streptomyces prunicolor]|uniref:hypothetical protein n=1 Tax=Streptomyces prunicolor TaxID=67348 RepID=UPI0003630FC9|nr:hypothetical protein [Streptomyces prunicolor]